MRSRGIPWNMPLVTCIVFVYTPARHKARVYTENTSDAWHIPRYPARKHCMTTIYFKTQNALLVMPCYKKPVYLSMRGSYLATDKQRYRNALKPPPIFNSSHKAKCR